MAVYFLQAGVDGLVKIGYSRNPARRLSALRSVQSADSAVLGVISGGRALEAELHVKFAPFRVRGEWFSPDESILKFCNDNCSPLSRIVDLSPAVAETENDKFSLRFARAMGAALCEIPAFAAASSAGVSIETVKKWRAGETAPGGASLTKLMGAHDGIFNLVLEIAGRSIKALTAGQRRTIADALKILGEQ